MMPTGCSLACKASGRIASWPRAASERATRSGMADNSGVRCNSDTMVRMAPDSTATCGKPAAATALATRL